MDSCYVCGRTGEQVSALLVEEAVKEIDAKITALSKEKQSLGNEFGDITAVWNSLNTKLKNLNNDLLSLNFETLEKNFGNVKNNIVTDVLEFMKKTPGFRLESFSVQDVIANFEKYRPKNVRLEEIEKEIVELELRKRSVAEKMSTGFPLIELKDFSVKTDSLRSAISFEPLDSGTATTDFVRVPVCKICASLMRAYARPMASKN